ncbi:large-conductance mechanosensitive channel protein MscL [Tahibacter amnicola]|uniref:Large-conductance mechanosensitive channel n=1 Tax=Tahibacter amnicola TaxID=2976241 RepID=A0ABY6BG71_9GAMM|nr:large-conductance mechanosensitive channel protein MscL [Tahibacter amnicola]UXI68835.1 large-conductance mechanosensitive channel protein MscL [Tahibacter amnicola]
MSFFSEFKAFAMRGNVVDLAVGVIIGAAFGDIVKALVDNVMMPPIGYLIGGIDFSSLVWRIGDPAIAKDGTITGGILIKYGLFLNTLIKFTIIAFAIFLVVKVINRMTRRQPAPGEMPADVKLLTEIRDLLAKDKATPTA